MPCIPVTIRSFTDLLNSKTAPETGQKPTLKGRNNADLKGGDRDGPVVEHANCAVGWNNDRDYPGRLGISKRE